MNIEPLSPPAREISVTEPLSLSLAYERMSMLLFRPFDLGKWFAIGFCAWLAGLGESGGGSFGYHNSFGSSHHGQPLSQLRHGYDDARDYMLANLAWLLPLVFVVVLLVVALGLLVLWFNCRGKFMFLHCVATNRAEIAIPWERCGRSANSLFVFRLEIALISLFVTLPLVILLVLLIVRMVRVGRIEPLPLLGSFGLGAILFLWMFFLIVLQKFLVDFVVPIMYLRQSSCLAAWREFSRLLSAHVGSFVLYLLIQFVLALALGMLIFTVFVFTCCVACCVASLPYIGTVFLLPILTFQRSYSLCFLSQFGSLYNVFSVAQPPVVAPPPPGLQPL